MFLLNRLNNWGHNFDCIEKGQGSGPPGTPARCAPVCLCLSEVIFPLLYTSFENWMFSGMSSLVRKTCFIQAYKARVNNCHQQRKVGAACFSFHICWYTKMIMLHDSLLILKKLSRHNQWILLEFSIKTNEFVWLLMSYFFNEK